LEPAGIVGLTATLLIMIVSEFLFFSGEEVKAIFVGLWAPTLLGFLNYLKLNKQCRGMLTGSTTATSKNMSRFKIFARKEILGLFIGLATEELVSLSFDFLYALP
jgi:hypothetical protein